MRTFIRGVQEIDEAKVNYSGDIHKQIIFPENYNKISSSTYSQEESK